MATAITRWIDGYPFDTSIAMGELQVNVWSKSQNSKSNLGWSQKVLKFILDFAHGLGLKHAAAVTKVLIHFHPKSAVSATYQVHCIPSSRCQCFLLQRAGPNL